MAIKLKITNGNYSAEVEAGKTVTVKCGGKKLAEDLVFEAVAVEEVKPQTLIVVKRQGSSDYVVTFDITEYVGQTFSAVVGLTAVGTDGATYKLTNTINGNYMYVVNAADQYSQASINAKSTDTIQSDIVYKAFLVYN